MPDREKVINELDKLADEVNPWKESPPLRCDIPYPLLCDVLALLKEQKADKNKYEYKYDHTDCLWYESGNCPSTCSQYRDGWNDAMDYIFKDGKGYQPYRRLVKRE